MIYFDLCRELIGAAWSWCENDETQRRLGGGEDCRPALVEVLRGRQSGVAGESLRRRIARPSFIIECSRRRVPRGVGCADHRRVGV